MKINQLVKIQIVVYKRMKYNMSKNLIIKIEINFRWTFWYVYTLSHNEKKK